MCHVRPPLCQGMWWQGQVGQVLWGAHVLKHNLKREEQTQQESWLWH